MDRAVFLVPTVVGRPEVVAVESAHHEQLKGCSAHCYFHTAGRLCGNKGFWCPLAMKTAPVIGRVLTVFLEEEV
jgi:hypothetical protein